MFQTFTHIQRRRGRDGQSRQEYLQQLVDQYKEADSIDSKRKILANLSNFAYDPINYRWLYQACAAELFVDAFSDPEGDPELRRIGLFGLCNSALDHHVQERLANDEEFIRMCKGIILADAKYSSEFLMTTVCLLWHICTPKNINIIITPDLKNALEGLCNAENRDVALHNMCSIFLSDFFVETPKEPSDELSEKPSEEPSAKRRRST
ncbi:hypothetical protein BGW37DRAFT_116919 [Umbelopsis sp. PMI_123]|nr:hypothetical protein BGW37DRAFT_116919 [Umbelopsis sp. PMI_123]